MGHNDGDGECGGKAEAGGDGIALGDHLDRDCPNGVVSNRRGGDGRGQPWASLAWAWINATVVGMGVLIAVLSAVHRSVVDRTEGMGTSAWW